MARTFSVGRQLSWQRLPDGMFVTGHLSLSGNTRVSWDQSGEFKLLGIISGGNIVFRNYTQNVDILSLTNNTIYQGTLENPVVTHSYNALDQLGVNAGYATFVLALGEIPPALNYRVVVGYSTSLSESVQLLNIPSKVKYIQILSFIQAQASGTSNASVSLTKNSTVLTKIYAPVLAGGYSGLAPINYTALGSYRCVNLESGDSLNLQISSYGLISLRVQWAGIILYE